MVGGNSCRASVSPDGDLGFGGTWAGNRDDVTVVRTTVVVVVVVVVVVGVGRGHGEYGGGGGVWFGELWKSILDLYTNRYHRPLSDITTISGTRSYAHILKPIDLSKHSYRLVTDNPLIIQ
jgi:hypothetical protein